MTIAIVSVVHGYHIYLDIWSAEIDLELPCLPESGYHKDQYAVAMQNDTQVVGRVRQKISFICHLFLSWT